MLDQLPVIDFQSEFDDKAMEIEVIVRYGIIGQKLTALVDCPIPTNQIVCRAGDVN